MFSNRQDDAMAENGITPGNWPIPSNHPARYPTILPIPAVYLFRMRVSHSVSQPANQPAWQRMNCPAKHPAIRPAKHTVKEQSKQLHYLPRSIEGYKGAFSYLLFRYFQILNIINVVFIQSNLKCIKPVSWPQRSYSVTKGVSITWVPITHRYSTETEGVHQCIGQYVC